MSKTKVLEFSLAGQASPSKDFSSKQHNLGKSRQKDTNSFLGSFVQGKAAQKGGEEEALSLSQCFQKKSKDFSKLDLAYRLSTLAMESQNRSMTDDVILQGTPALATMETYPVTF